MNKDNNKEENCAPVVGLIASTAVLLGLLVVQTIGVVCFVWKVKTAAKKYIKEDVNPIYGIEDERKKEDQRNSSEEQHYDYMEN